MNYRRNLCKFYDSTVEKGAKFLITNTIMYFISILKIIYHTEDSILYVDNISAMCTFERFVAQISIARSELLKTLIYAELNDFLKQLRTIFSKSLSTLMYLVAETP